jgi:predicted dehydrogenase
MMVMQKSPSDISRRRFLQRTGSLAMAAGLPAWWIERELALAASAPRPLSANDRPGIALVGCGGMGRGDARNAARFGDVVAVCDVDEAHVRAAAKDLTREGKAPRMFRDFREVMTQEGVHVVIQATPDHWHTLVNLAATQAGKDVYGEKPQTLTIDEGRRLVKAVRQHQTVLQTGSQQRSDSKFRLACELVRNERIGKLREIEVYLPAGLREGPFSASAPPAELDWNFWLGPAPTVDYVKQRCHTTFRFWYDYSGGTLTDWGAHHNDIARWALGLDGPSEIEAQTLVEPIPGGYTAISEYEITLTYANGVRQVIRTTRDDSIFGGVINREGQRHGVKFIGTEGWVWVTRGDIQASNDDLLTTPLPDDALRLEVSGDHMRNFFDCVRSRKDPICHVEIGHRSASLCHLGVIALRLGRKLRWNPDTERFVGDGASEANGWVAREMRQPYDYRFIA